MPTKRPYPCDEEYCHFQCIGARALAYHKRTCHSKSNQTANQDTTPSIDNIIMDEANEAFRTVINRALDDQSATVDTTNEPLLFDIKSTESYHFTKSELYSIKLNEIVDTYAIPREAAREIVNLHRDTVKSNECKTCVPIDEPNTWIYPETIAEKLKKKTHLKAKTYQVCTNGCMLYDDDDQETAICRNAECKEPRYKANGQPVRVMKIFSIGDQIASMLANSKIRDLMKYRHNYDSQPNKYCDYFDGDAYKELREEGYFAGEDDVALALFVDGFTATKSSQSAHLTIVHLINLNLPPEYRYQDMYTRQIAILPGPNNPKSLLDTFLKPIIRELKSLSSRGMDVRCNSTTICHAKVYLVMATGYLPASAELAHHMTSCAEYGCRICLTRTKRIDKHTCFLNTGDPLQTAEHFTHPDPNNQLGVRSSCIFKELDTLRSPFFFSQDELHLICHGVGKTVFDLLTVSLGKSYNTCIKLMEDPSDYPFWIDKSQLIKMGKLVAESKPNVSVSFSSKWVDPIKYTGGNRAVDNLNFLLYIVPSFFVPYLKSDAAKTAVLKLVQACALSLQWEITKEDVDTIRKHFKAWTTFLLKEIDDNHVKPGIMKPIQHYLSHIADTILQNGPLRVYSTRSQERSIGKYKKLIKSKSNVGENAANVMERLATRSYIDTLPWEIAESLDMVSAGRYKPDSFRSLVSVDSEDTEFQLWEPFTRCSSASLPCNVPQSKFISALQNFYMRVSSSSLGSANSSIDCLLSGRAWAFNKVYSSTSYADHIKEHRRGNSFIMFKATHRNTNNHLKTNWYIGSVVFFFEHTNAEDTRHLLLVSLCRENLVATHDPCLPKVKMYAQHHQQSYAVIRFEDIVCSVSLVKTEYERTYHVIARHIHKKTLRPTAGSVGNL